MRNNVTLEEFVEAFSTYGENVSPESWVLKDLGLDADELDWALRSVSSDLGWQYAWETDLSGHLPKEAWPWTKRNKFADLKVRELYAYSGATKPS